MDSVHLNLGFQILILKVGWISPPPLLGKLQFY
jgi:hypothetical protein